MSGLLAGLDPEYDRRVRALIAAAQEDGHTPAIASGYRTSADQARAIDQVSQNVLGRPASVVEYSRGIKGYAAPVGGSMHEQGKAVDFSADGKTLAWLRENAPNYGVSFPGALARTDSNHAEVDKKFWGPVQDPRDRERTADAPSPMATTMAGYGRPAGPAGAVARAIEPPRSHVAAAARMPEPDKPAPNFLEKLGQFATNTVSNPLVQAGAGMMAAGAKGMGLGAGVLAAGETMAEANKRERERRAQLAEVEQQRTRARLWNDMITQESPAWAKDLPAGTLELARALGPDEGSKLAVGLVTKHAAGWLDRAKLDETRRDHDIKNTMAQAQLEEARNVNADRALTQETIRRQRQQEIQQQEETARRRAALFGAGPTAPAPAPQQDEEPPATAQPQSYQGGQQQGDPLLIPAQAAQAPAPPRPPAPLQAAGPLPPGMVQTPRGPMAPEDAVRLGQGLLAESDPGMRALGQDIIKRAAEAREKGLDKGAKAETEKSMVGDINHLARLNDIERQYQENFLQLPERLRLAVMAGSEIIGTKLNPADREALWKLTQFRQATISNFNLLLKEASGAAVTQQEFDRMKLQEPNAEWTGIFGRWDSNTEFQAKLQNGKRMAISAIARKNYLRNMQGLNDQQIAELAKGGGAMPISIESMPGLMKQWEQQRALELRRANPRLQDADVTRQTAVDRQKVFGI